MNATNQTLSTTSAHDAVTAAYAAVSAIQTMPPAQQVAGAAVLFVALCEVLNLDRSEVMNKAQRMTLVADSYYTTTVRSLREYIKQEIK